MLRSTFVLMLALSAAVAAAPTTPQIAAPAAPPATVTMDARSLQPGEVVVVTIATGAPAGAVRARAFDRDWTPFRLDPLTWEVVIGIDLDVAPGAHTVDIQIDRQTGTERLTHSIAVTAKQFRTRRLTVDRAYVEPPADVQARIVEEAVLLTSIWKSSPPERLWTGGFVRPVPHEANSAFGTRSIFNGQPRSPHGGADFLSPARTPVHAPNGGRIVLAKDLYYTGGTVVIDHGLGLVSLFAHLSRIDVTAGDDVATGDVVGLVGSTGRVTGPHLHWTVRLGGTRVDPLSLLAVMGGN